MLLNKSKSKITEKVKAPAKPVKVNKDISTETEKTNKNVHPEYNKLLHRQGKAKIKVFNQKHNPKDLKAQEVSKVINDLNFETEYLKNKFKLLLRDKDNELIQVMLEENIIVNNSDVKEEYNLKLSKSSISHYVSKLSLPFLFSIQKYSLRKDVEELIKLKIIY